ncbi:methionine/alanine import family NSS transporter small subunit [Ornithinimicrobium sp. Y1694]|uniref:methionine/alanine import family NSS transporter small subunit n=1 Tax=Ornithinimicrobium sp. Y1694 TaxID=3418590 RepID=UPI003CEF30DB
MTPVAVVMMIVAIALVWGGLIASILFLRSQPEVSDHELPDPDVDRGDQDRLSGPHPDRDL